MCVLTGIASVITIVYAVILSVMIINVNKRLHDAGLTPERVKDNKEDLALYVTTRKGHLAPQIVCCLLTIVLCILYTQMNGYDHRRGVLRVVSGVIVALSVYGIVAPYVYCMTYMYDPEEETIIDVLAGLVWLTVIGILIFSSCVLTLVSSSLVLAKV